MRKQNSKLIKTMMLGTLAFMMMSSFKVNATEMQIFKCIKPEAQVIYQDFACNEDQIMQVLDIKINQSADSPGLRSYEEVVLERVFQRQMQELSRKS